MPPQTLFCLPGGGGVTPVFGGSSGTCCAAAVQVHVPPHLSPQLHPTSSSTEDLSTAQHSSMAPLPTIGPLRTSPRSPLPTAGGTKPCSSHILHTPTPASDAFAHNWAVCPQNPPQIQPQQLQHPRPPGEQEAGGAGAFPTFYCNSNRRSDKKTAREGAGSRAA